ncbi:unnamed protein product, partial [Ixodes pacificus]
MQALFLCFSASGRSFCFRPQISHRAFCLPGIQDQPSSEQINIPPAGPQRQGRQHYLGAMMGLTCLSWTSSDLSQTHYSIPTTHTFMHLQVVDP